MALRDFANRMDDIYGPGSLFNLGATFLGGQPGDLSGSMGRAGSILAQMQQAEAERREREEALKRDMEERKLRMERLRLMMEDDAYSRDLRRESGPGTFEYEKQAETQRALSGVSPEELQAPRGGGVVRRLVEAARREDEERGVNLSYKRAGIASMSRPKVPKPSQIPPSVIYNAMRKEMTELAEVIEATKEARLPTPEGAEEKLLELRTKLSEFEQEFYPRGQVDVGTPPPKSPSARGEAGVVVPSDVPPEKRGPYRELISKYSSQRTTEEMSLILSVLEAHGWPLPGTPEWKAAFNDPRLAV